MRRILRQLGFFEVLGKANLLLFIGSAITTALLEAKAEDIKSKMGAQLAQHVLALQQMCWWLVPLLLLLAGIFEGIRRWIGRPLQWKSIQATLDAIDKHLFKEYLDSTSHYHRVTLFRRDLFHPCIRLWPFYFRFSWPWSGWMVPVARSSHTYQQMLSIFIAPDDPLKAEGVAGRTWAHRSRIDLPNLPDISANSPEADKKAHEDASFFPLKRYLRKNLRARSFYGLPVYVDNEPWGAIVIDSSQPSLKKNRIQDIINLHLPILDQLLKDF